MFNVSPCLRAVPDTPEEPIAARVVVLRDGCCLRPIWRGSASPIVLRGYVWVHLCSARKLALPRAPTGTSRSCAAGRATCVDDLSHGESPSSHWWHAAFHGAPRPPDVGVVVG